jgi:outer membrane protein assembly factor BamB
MAVMRLAAMLGLSAALATPAGFGATRPSVTPDWPQAGGPDRNGVIRGESILAPAGGSEPKVAWRANAGHGASPVVVSGGRLYVYGVFKPGASMERLDDVGSTPSSAEVGQIAGCKDPALRSSDVPGTPDFAKQECHGIYRGDGYVQCLDAATGKRIWATRLTDWGIVLWGNWLAAERSSPAIANGLLFIHTINGRLHCLDAATGKPRWEVNLFDHGMIRWDEKNGNACSPLVVGNTVVVAFMAGELDDYSKWQNCVSAVAGFDVATGKRRWVTKSPNRTFRAMSSDIGYAILGGRPTVLLPDGTGTTGIAPTSGTVLWSYKVDFDAQKATMTLTMPLDVRFAYPSRLPVAWKSLVVDAVSMGHDDKPSQMWAVDLASGRPRRAWYTHECVPVTAETDKSNFVVRDGLLYAFDAHGVWDGAEYDGKIDRRPMRSAGKLQCRDLATGKLIWSTDALSGRPRGDEEIYRPSHLLLVGDTMVVTDQFGLWFAQIGKTGARLLSRFGEYEKWGGHLHSPPVVCAGRLFVRKEDADAAHGLMKVFGGGGNLICLDLRPLVDAARRTWLPVAFPGPQRLHEIGPATTRKRDALAARAKLPLRPGAPAGARTVPLAARHTLGRAWRR